MEPLYLVDGSGYIFRAFFAVQHLSNSSGLPTNALLGFTRMLIKLLRDEKVKYVAVAFDTDQPTFRHEMFVDYKANRAECPSNLVPQLPYFKRIVEALGIRCLQKPGVEADDIIGTIVATLRRVSVPIVVVSGDKDLTQLVDEQTSVWDAMRDIRFTRALVKEKFGVYPEQIVDYLALTGDSSDNVPGVKGIGAKSAEALLGFFGTLDSLVAGLERIEQIPDLRGKASIKKKIESDLPSLRLSRELVSLRLDVDPFCEVVHIDEFIWRGANLEQARPLFSELEFSTVLNSLPAAPAPAQLEAPFIEAVHDVERVPPKDKTPETAKCFSCVECNNLADFAATLAKLQEFAFDTETTSLDPLNCELVGISFSWERQRGYYIPLKGAQQGPGAVHHDLRQVREFLGPIFANEKIRKIGLNLKFDINVLEAHDIPVRGAAFDSMLASYVLSPDKRQHGLKALALSHLGETMVEYAEITEGLENFAHVSVADATNYACHDAEASWSLREVFERLLGPSPAAVPSLRYVFEEIEMPLVEVLARMERTGIKIDAQLLNRLSTRFEEGLRELEQQIHIHAGTQFNINSPKQLSDILFGVLGLPTAGVKRTQTAFSTDAGVLAKLAPQYEIAQLLLDYRELFKLKSTYTDALQRLIDPATGRIHTSFNQAVAATGRLSSSEPNLQNIPIRNQRGREIRQAFIAEKGCELISADYSQIELRILAHMSGDQSLSQAFMRGEDIHAATANELFPGQEDEQGNLRRIAKTINFGVIYGISAFRLSDQLGVSRRDAQKYIDGYFARYPKVREFLEGLSVEASERGYVETFFGRRRYLRDIDTTGRDRGYAIRSLLNFPIQGTAAEVIKLAMIRLYRRLQPFGEKARIVLQVHDELVVEVDSTVRAQVAETVVTEMESAVELTVPLKVDVEIFPRWGGEA